MNVGQPLVAAPLPGDTGIGALIEACGVVGTVGVVGAPGAVVGGDVALDPEQATLPASRAAASENPAARVSMAGSYGTLDRRTTK